MVLYSSFLPFLFHLPHNVCGESGIFFASPFEKVKGFYVSKKN
ncbi:Hypothetical protein BN2458_PEG0845 [Helicobacter typhlonius]|uniref:Uncharacterized protein n=1 Tax=Helicobacter typhlonius TaxID=76936 RepID=A0A0S4PTV9_9HELI|nr:Hypothetical protein BN2458_PEG0845 [Helicobacter typhlonius]